MTKVQGALIKEQGVRFAIVIVKSSVIQSRARSDEARASFAALFPSVPIVLMAQDYRGTPTYYGRSDLVRFLKDVPLEAIPWREWRLAA